MPEFQLDYGSREAAQAFRQLDSFTQGYIEAMFFTEANPDNEELENATIADLSPEAWAKIETDCFLFRTDNEYLLEQAYKNEVTTYDAERAGNDFWFTRNGHGCGFWARDELGVIGNDLTKAAKQFREQDLYRGDDGHLYLS